MSTKRYFNRNRVNSKKSKSKKFQKKLFKSSSNLIVKSGMPYDTILAPSNGQFYVNKDSGNTYLYADTLGWIDMSGWQPDVGEGVPETDNPPNPINGDQYLNVLNGDLYVFNEGFGWVMINGVEGPRGPPGESFSFELETYQDGVHGPLLSGPFKIEPGKCVRLWIENGQIYSDVI